MVRREKPLRAGIGARALLLPRVSTQKQEKEGTSLKTQEAAMREYCEQRGYRIYDVLPDTYTGTELDRPALNKARQLVRAEEIDVLIIYAFDRISRNETNQAIVLHEAKWHGVSVEAVSEQLDDTPHGRMVRTILGIFAEVEHEKILERTSRGLRSRVESGKLKTGSLPLYGYRWIYQENGSRRTRDAYALDEETFPIVKWIFDEAMKGVTCRAIARSLNERGIPTPSQVLARRGELGGRPLGARWHRAIIDRILRNPAYKGQMRAYRRQHQEYYKADEATGIEKRINTTTARDEEETILISSDICPAIVESTVWDAVQVRLLKNKDEATRHNNHEAELPLLRAGHIYCGHCKRKACSYWHKPTQQYKYKCNYMRAQVDGGKVGDPCEVNGFTHLAKPIDEEVWDRITMMLISDGSEQSLLEQVVEYRRSKRLGDEDMDNSTLASVNAVYEDAKKRVTNAERAYSDALGKDYDLSMMEFLMIQVNNAKKDLRTKERDRAAILENLEARKKLEQHTMTAFAELRGFKENIKDADYATKRRWLWLLGVRVYVYREGTYTDDDDNRWRLRFEWEGLESQMILRMQQEREQKGADEIVNYTAKSTIHNIAFLPPLMWEEILALSQEQPSTSVQTA